MKKARTHVIKVDALARVEGEGALTVRVRAGKVEEIAFRIFEPPRFFEAFLRGRAPAEAPDLTARICGICPVAYQMSSVHAIENALGVAVPKPIRELRRLLYCGEWIESHVLHVYMLHAPDFLGYEDALRMAKDHPDAVERGLRLKKAGNAIVAALGGREIHPVNVRLGGFYKAPSRRDFAPLAESLKRARDEAVETVAWTASLPCPDLEPGYPFVALRHPSEYPFNEGRVVSDRGLDIDVRDYDAHFTEEHVARSNALHSILKGQGAYFVGPLARYSLNADRLSPIARDAAKKAGLGPVCRNPFKSIVVRAVETLYAVDEALRILESYEPPDPPAVPAPLRPGTGHAATEAPRGLLYHRYRIGEDGLLADAKIVPPTSQNQKAIEEDLRDVVEANLHLSQDRLRDRCEQAIRNYDPCISCATHFLDLRVERLP
jgi:coenzyme F420-reducing hydrogenase alpha subunit